ncbi:hypothetical protein F3K50_10615 [Pseudomonas marginalis]|nr:hypothetical protein F3K50_10615 [Pseudomonas marginalis]
MSAFKAKVTRWIIKFSSRFPYLVSARLRFLAKSESAGKSKILADVYAKEDLVEKASLFEGDISWKGVSFVMSINKSELSKIHKWMKSQSRSLGNYSDSHGEGVSSSNLIGAGLNNLGIVSFDKPNMFAVGSVSIKAELPNSCYVTLLRLKSGVYYLSLYVYFDKKVKDHIASLDVRNATRYKVFQTLNPFSPRFSVVEHHDRMSVIEEAVLASAREVVTEATQAASALLQLWGVKKSQEEMATVADFFREGEGSYFSEESSIDLEMSESETSIVKPWQGRFMCWRLSEEVSEDYIGNYIPEKIGVDAIFIKSQNSSVTDVNDNYMNALTGVTHYYGFVLMLQEIYARFERCMHEVSPVFLSYDKNTERNLNMLLEAGLELNAIEERLAAVEEGLHWSAKRYLNFTRGRIAGMRSHVVSFRADIEKRRALSDGQVQMKNLIWMRRYSIMVFVLVIVQIALSLLNVNWTESARNTNPIYMNLFSLVKHSWSFLQGHW